LVLGGKLHVLVREGRFRDGKEIKGGKIALQVVIMRKRGSIIV
jgi:hypothetical protein